MSCYPKCPVPNFLLPKKHRPKQTTDCIERCEDVKCTGYQLYAIPPRREHCMSPQLAELLRCHACQEQRMNRLMANKHNQYQCHLRKYMRQGPEIPFLWKPDRPDIKFIRHGYVIDDCFPHDVRKDACSQRAAWKKQVKCWIKNLSHHYNSKVASATERPIEDYIRLNLGNMCVSCEANEAQRRLEAEKCSGQNQMRPGCMKVELRCGTCRNGKKNSRH